MLILIDGVCQGGGSDVIFNGFFVMNIGFMFFLVVIECIEVIRGLMFILYGFDVMGGVVNIIIRKNVDKWFFFVNVGLNLQESNKWGNSSQFNFWSSGFFVDDFVSLQVCGSI